VNISCLINNGQKTFAITPTNVVPLSCSVSPVTVDLGNVAQTAFKKWTDAGRKLATLNITNCPAGMSKVSYKFTPLYSYDNATGLVSLDSTSTAKNVLVHLTDTQSANFPLDVDHTLTDYQPSSGGNYTASFYVAYYPEFDPLITPVTPGSANTSLTVTMTYQ